MRAFFTLFPICNNMASSAAHTMSSISNISGRFVTLVLRLERRLRYRKGLPPAVMKMNEECLRLRPHDHPGYQTVDDIRRIVREAIGAAAADPDDLVDDLIGDDEIYF